MRGAGTGPGPRVSFKGFPPAAFEFYEQLEADNTKAFWQANKPTYEDSVRAPMVALCAELEDYGPFHLFRPYNDLRFAKNRPPYKTHQGAFGESEGGSGYYVHLGADGMLAGCGYYSMAQRPTRAIPCRRRRRRHRQGGRRRRRLADHGRATASGRSTSSSRHRAATPRTTPAST